MQREIFKSHSKLCFGALMIISSGLLDASSIGIIGGQDLNLFAPYAAFVASDGTLTQISEQVSPGMDISTVLRLIS